MSKQDDMLLYTDHDWGVYKYDGITKDVALELVKFSGNHPNNVCLDWYADKEYAKTTKRLFNLSELRFYLYYYERDLELYREIEDNEILRNAWSDSDCYTLTDESIDRIKVSTQETKKLLLALLKMNEEFEAITYNK